MPKLVIGAFQRFGCRLVNNAALVARKLQQPGQLHIAADVDVEFHKLDVNGRSIDDFVRQARDSHADYVLLLGEDGFSTFVEERAYDRGVPASAPVTVVKDLFGLGSREYLRTAAPVKAMAAAGHAQVSHDAGYYYCNYAYHSALKAGLNAVFVHVPGTPFGLGTGAYAAKVDRMLGAWLVTGGAGAGD